MINSTIRKTCSKYTSFSFMHESKSNNSLLLGRLWGVNWIYKRKNNQFKEFSIHVNINSRIKIVLEHVIEHDILEDEEKKHGIIYIFQIFTFP